MCDYSLHSVASRPAKVGDKLVTTTFHGTSTRGFATVGEPNMAVCLIPGTEVAFEREVRHEGLWRSKNTRQTTAVFRQLDKNTPGVFHDALEFADGQIVLLTQLKKRQHATVLQLPALPSGSHGAGKKERVSVVA
jgi:hypothetical protein